MMPHSFHRANVGELVVGVPPPVSNYIVSPVSVVGESVGGQGGEQDIEAVPEAFHRGASGLDAFAGSGRLASGFTFRRTCDIDPHVCAVLVELNRQHHPGAPRHLPLPLQ